MIARVRGGVRGPVVRDAVHRKVAAICSGCGGTPPETLNAAASGIALCPACVSGIRYDVGGNFNATFPLQLMKNAQGVPQCTWISDKIATLRTRQYLSVDCIGTPFADQTYDLKLYFSVANGVQATCLMAAFVGELATNYRLFLESQAIDHPDCGAEYVFKNNVLGCADEPLLSRPVASLGQISIELP